MLEPKNRGPGEQARLNIRPSVDRESDPMAEDLSLRGTTSSIYRRFRFIQAFENRDFRLLWMSSMATSFAMQLQLVARGWLTYDITQSALALTWVMLSFMLPSVVFSLFGGLIADRLSKKPILIISQLLNVVATAILAVIIYTDRITFEFFIYFGLFNGTVMSISMPARTTIIPEIVGRRLIINAMALSSTTYNLARIVGPTLAGGLIAWFAAGDTSSVRGTGIVFFIITALYVLSVACTVALRYRGESIARPRTLSRDLLQSFLFLRRERVVVGLLIMGLVPFMFGFAASHLLPVFTSDVLAGGPEKLGFLLTAIGVGALGGSLALAQIGDTRRKGRILFYSGYAWAVSLVFFGLSPNIWTAIPSGALTGLFGAVMGSLNMSVLQLVVPQQLRGRIMAINWMIHGLMPIGMLPIAWIAESTSIQFAIVISAILLTLSMWLLRQLYPEVRKLGRSDLSDLDESDIIAPRTSEKKPVSASH